MQEAFTNIAKYSHAKNIEIILRRKEDSVYLSVSDDGVGFDLESFMKRPWRRKEDKVRLGLQGLKERMELLGGSLSVYSAAGRGTKLEAELPI